MFGKNYDKEIERVQEQMIRSLDAQDKMNQELLREIQEMMKSNNKLTKSVMEIAKTQVQHKEAIEALIRYREQ